ncbi:MAG: transketolase C-terminal domain-containing protein [Pseudomonadota bacterium]
MRKEFSNIILDIIKSNNKTVFITGDLGFNALENIQAVAKERFINAGVAEQNMVGVAAGLAYKGFETFTYSIAPFAVFRCLEQIKIDVCIHNLPVYIVGNGGGYGYGIMGATHHAIEDIACLSALPNMTCWVPAFTEDVEYCIQQITALKKPAYLRLGLGKSYPTKANIGTINKVIDSQNPAVTVIAMGPVVHNVLEAIGHNNSIDLFTVISIPFLKLSEDLIASISKTKKVLIVEEHVERGGVAEYLLLKLTKLNLNNLVYKNINAKGYPSKLYGSQSFHQKESGLDAENIKQQLNKLQF